MAVADISNDAAPGRAAGRDLTPLPDPAVLREAIPGAFQRELPGLGAMVGCSAAMQHLFSRMRTIAPHFRLASVEGETGVGKMLAAQTLHRMGPAQRHFGQWTAAEFLDHAQEIWRDAGGGLLYLSHTDELTPQQQTRLRDFLDEAAQERIRVQETSGPLQVVAGSAQGLRRAAAAGTFRSDLAGHLSAIRFAIPPLRERREDIPLLAELFLRRYSAEHRKSLHGFAAETMERLRAHPWPGNVRELERVVGAAALETRSQWIRPMDLPPLEWPAEAQACVKNSEEDANLDRAILRHIARVLARVQGNKLRAARMLGISRSTLYRMLSTEDQRVAAVRKRSEAIGD